MTVFVLEDSSKSFWGGGQKITFTVMSILAKYNFPVLLFDFKRDTLFKQKAGKYSKKNITLSGAGSIVKNKSSAFSVGKKELFSFPFYLVINLYKIRKEFKLLKQNDKPVVYAATNKTLVYAFFLNVLWGIPYYFHAHSYFSPRSAAAKVYNYFYKRAVRVICVSETIEKMIKTGNTAMIYNPVVLPGKPETITQPRSLRNKNIIVIASFSSLLKWKGIEYFIKSFPLIKSKKRIMFNIYGEGEEKEHLMQYQNENISLKGFADNIYEQLQNTDIVVAPSIAEESFGLSIAEAMSMAVPVIVTGIGGQAEIAPDNETGIHVPLKDSAAIAKAIDKLINNEQLYERLSAGALERAGLFSINKFEENIMNIFSAL